MMTHYLSEDELDGLMKTFQEIDTNNDGNLTVQELSDAMARSQGGNVKLEEIKKMMAEADLDGDGVLSYKELMLTAVNKKLLNKEERLWEAFSKLDLDGNGKVTAAEISAVLGVDSEAAKLIAEADTDGDG